MFPVLFAIGNFKFFTFGLFLALALLWAGYFLWKLVKITIHKEDDVFDIAFISLWWSFVAGRLLYVATHWSEFSDNVLYILLVHTYPGIDATAMLLVFMFGIWWFGKKNKIAFHELVDILMPPVFLAIAIAKLGAFFGGTLIGAQTNFLLSVLYFGYEGQRHIVALYQAAVFGLFAYLLYQAIFLIKRNVLPKGSNLPLAAMAYFSINLATYPLLDPMYYTYWNRIPVLVAVWGVLLLTSIIYLGYTIAPMLKKHIKKHKK